MVDPIIQQAGQKIAEQSLQQTAAGQGAGGPGQPAAGVQARFEAALQGPADPQAVGNVQAAGNANLAASAQATPPVAPADGTLGDAILNGLEQMRTRHDVRMERIEAQLLDKQGADLTVQDAMALQFEVMQLGIEQELTTKVADKTSQGVQTLFHNQ